MGWLVPARFVFCTPEKPKDILGASSANSGFGMGNNNSETPFNTKAPPISATPFAIPAAEPNPTAVEPKVAKVKPPKAKARPEKQEKSQGRFRGFVAPPRKTKKETMPKTTGPGNTSSIMKQTRKPKQFKKIEQGPYRGGNVLKNKVEQIPKKPRDQRAGGGKVGNKYFTGGMVNPSYGTEFDDR